MGFGFEGLAYKFKFLKIGGAELRPKSGVLKILGRRWS